MLGERIVNVPCEALPVAGVDELAAAVRETTGGLGERDRYAFRGHLTVARTRPGASSELLGVPIAATFEVAEVAVVASQLTPNGAVYTTLATFPTVNRAGPNATRSRRRRR